MEAGGGRNPFEMGQRRAAPAGPLLGPGAGDRETAGVSEPGLGGREHRHRLFGLPPGDQRARQLLCRHRRHPVACRRRHERAELPLRSLPGTVPLGEQCPAQAGLALFGVGAEEAVEHRGGLAVLLGPLEDHRLREERGGVAGNEVLGLRGELGGPARDDRVEEGGREA